MKPRDPDRAPLALVFDLDGTLVDSRDDIASACNAALVALGLPPLPAPAIRPMIGDGARALIVRALRASGRADDEAEVEAALAAYAEHYAANPCTRTTLLPGARRVLALGLPAAVVTNKLRSVTDLVLERLGLAGAFTSVVGGGDGPLKPSPDGVLAALRAMGVRAAEAWMIGDGPQDVLAGRAAGCRTIAVPGIAEEAALAAARPDHLARDLEEIADVLAALRAATSPPA